MTKILLAPEYSKNPKEPLDEIEIEMIMFLPNGRIIVNACDSGVSCDGSGCTIENAIKDLKEDILRARAVEKSG
jgi:hypothetical protein